MKQYCYQLKLWGVLASERPANWVQSRTLERPGSGGSVKGGALWSLSRLTASWQVSWQNEAGRMEKGGPAHVLRLALNPPVQRQASWHNLLFGESAKKEFIEIHLGIKWWMEFGFLKLLPTGKHEANDKHGVLQVWTSGAHSASLAFGNNATFLYSHYVNSQDGTWCILGS